MDFLIVIMAGGIARRHVRMTAVIMIAIAELHNMSAILQLTDLQRHAVLV